jgi:hypothetical protein
LLHTDAAVQGSFNAGELSGYGYTPPMLQGISFGSIRACRLNHGQKYRMTMPDNDVLFFRGRSDRQRCNVCGQLTARREEDLSTTSIARPPKVDVSCSVDGVVVITSRVRRALDEIFPDATRIEPLQSNLFAFLPTATVAFDAEARRTKFEGLCSTCGQYQSVIGATPIMLVRGSAVEASGIARTDLEFGSDDEKAPLVVLGDEAAEKLIAHGFSGCEVLPA